MYQLVRGKPLEEIDFDCYKASSGKYRFKMCCNNIFTIDTETTSDYLDEYNRPFLFDYDNPKKAQDAPKHSVVYLWQFGIDEDTRYIGRDLYELCDLLYKLNQYCPHRKMVYCHNLAFDFVFFQNVFKITNVFARKPRHPMCCTLPDYNVELKCSYVLTNLSLESWAKSLNLPVQKHTGQIEYNTVLRTPKTPLDDSIIDYGLADLDVIYYGIKYYRDMYGKITDIPLTHTGKMRVECAKQMETEYYYCEKVSRLHPRNLEEYNAQAHAFVGGSVFCNWLYKNRVVKNVLSFDIASSYPWVLISCKYPSTPFYKASLKAYKQYMYNDKYVYLIKFECWDMESNYNCHFMSRSKALEVKGCESDNGRIIRCKYAKFILTSVDYELFLKCYSVSTEKPINVIWFKWSIAKPLNNKFRQFIIDLYKDKTTLKNVSGMESIYQNKKEYINSTYGDFVTKIFADTITYQQGRKKEGVLKEWDTEPLNDTSFAKALKSINRKKFKNYKAFCQGIYVTAWARKRIWDAVISGLDESIVYSDTDSLKVYDYKCSYFEEQNKVVLTRHQELAQELGIPIESFSPEDIKGIKHPIGVWECEEHYKEFKSLGCKQYIYRADDDTLHLTCAGVSKLAVKCFDKVDDFEIDRRLTEKELKGCTDGKGHTAEKLIPYYGDDYPTVVYPDGYVCRYRYGVCLMPTTFNLSITPNDLMYLYGEVQTKLNQVYYKGGIE